MANLKPDDIALWPDGEWCLCVDIESYSWKSDDYRIIEFGTAEWHALSNASTFD